MIGPALAASDRSPSRANARACGTAALLLTLAIVSIAMSANEPFTASRDRPAAPGANHRSSVQRGQSEKAHRSILPNLRPRWGRKKKSAETMQDPFLQLPAEETSTTIDSPPRRSSPLGANRVGNNPAAVTASGASSPPPTATPPDSGREAPPDSPTTASWTSSPISPDRPSVESPHGPAPAPTLNPSSPWSPAHSSTEMPSGPSSVRGEVPLSGSPALQLPAPQTWTPGTNTESNSRFFDPKKDPRYNDLFRGPRTVDSSRRGWNGPTETSPIAPPQAANLVESSQVPSVQDAPRPSLSALDPEAMAAWGESGTGPPLSEDAGVPIPQTPPYAGHPSSTPAPASVPQTVAAVPVPAEPVPADANHAGDGRIDSEPIPEARPDIGSAWVPDSPLPDVNGPAVSGPPEASVADGPDRTPNQLPAAGSQVEEVTPHAEGDAVADRSAWPPLGADANWSAPAFSLGGPPIPTALPTGAGAGEVDESARVLAVVGDQSILAGDLLFQIDQMLAPYEGQVSPEELDHQRQLLMEKLLPKVIENKLVYMDFLRSIPRDRFPEVQKQVYQEFNKQKLPEMLREAGVETAAELDAELREGGSSLAKQQRMFLEQVIGQQMVRQNVNLDQAVSHDELLTYYYGHLHEFEYPARVRWEQMMVRWDRFPTRAAALRELAEMGNEVIEGTPLADVARTRSHGLRSDEGGQHDWTRKGSLRSELLDQALFLLPVGQLSQIIEDDQGAHIIRVLERESAGRTDFAEVQDQIKLAIQNERFKQEVLAYIGRLKAKTFVWTAFDQSERAETSVASPLTSPLTR